MSISHTFSRKILPLLYIGVYVSLSVLVLFSASNAFQNPET